jgi:hypothetical protein
MSATTGFEGPAVTAAVTVDAAGALLGELDDVLWSARSAEELLEVNVALERLRSRLAAAQVQVAAEIDATDACAAEGWVSVPDYLTATAGGRRGSGNRLRRVARALAGDCQATRAALHAGSISPEQAEVVVRVIELLPVDPGLRREAERFLVEQAAHLNATELQVAGEHLLEVLDPDGVAKREERRLDRHERSAHLNRSLSLIDGGARGPVRAAAADRPRVRCRGTRPSRPRRPHLGRPGRGLPAAAGC